MVCIVRIVQRGIGVEDDGIRAGEVRWAVSVQRVGGPRRVNEVGEAGWL